MKILKPVLMVLSVSGLSFENKSHKMQTILYIFWNICMTVHNVDLLLYIIDNINDISIIFKEMSYVIGMLLTQVKSYIYLQHIKSYLFIYQTLCNIVNLRDNCSGIKLYQKAEKKIRIYFRCYCIALLCVVISLTSRSLFTVMYKYFMGSLTTSDWLQPIPTYLLSSKTSPEYEIIYITITLAYYGVMLHASSVDAMFLGIGIYIIFGFRDVQRMILDINETINNKQLHKELPPKIIKCIKLHNVMLECQIILQKITAQAIFVNVPSLLLIICCVILKITKRKDELLGSTSFIGIGVNVMILTYCYIGELITNEGTNVAEAAYNANWYKCEPYIRQFFLQIIHSSQKYRYFHGYFFHCSMETFSNILKASFSIAAIMHNFE